MHSRFPGYGCGLYGERMSPVSPVNSPPQAEIVDLCIYYIYLFISLEWNMTRKVLQVQSTSLSLQC